MKPRIIKPSTYFDKFLNLTPIISGMTIGCIMIAVCLNVIMRYFFNKPIIGVDEITEYLLLFITFFGSAWLLREEAHVNVDILLTTLSKKNNMFLGIVTSILGIFICYILVWYGSKVAWSNYCQGAYFSTILEIPKAPVLAIIPLGSLFLLIQFVRRTLKSLYSWRSLQRTAGKQAASKGDEF